MCASVYTCVHVCAYHEKRRWALDIGQTKGEAYFLLEWSLSGSHFYTFNSRCGLYQVGSCHVLSLWIKTLPRIPKNNRGKKKETHLGCSKERNQKAKKVTLTSRLYPHFSWGSLGPPGCACNPLSLDLCDFNRAWRQEGRLETSISHVGNPISLQFQLPVVKDIHTLIILLLTHGWEVNSSLTLLSRHSELFASLCDITQHHQQENAHYRQTDDRQAGR